MGRQGLYTSICPGPVAGSFCPFAEVGDVVRISIFGTAAPEEELWRCFGALHMGLRNIQLCDTISHM